MCLRVRLQGTADVTVYFYCRRTAWGLVAGSLATVWGHSHDSVALFAPWQNSVILEIKLLTCPTRRKLNYLSWE